MPNPEQFQQNQNQNIFEQLTQQETGRMSTWDIFWVLALPYIAVKMLIDPHDGSTPMERAAAAMERSGAIAITVSVWFIAIIVGIMIYNHFTGR